MQEFQDIAGIEDVNTRKSACEVLAFFGNLASGLEMGHIPTDVAEWLVEELLLDCIDVMVANGNPAASAKDFGEITVDEFWDVITDRMEEIDTYHFHRRKASSRLDGDKQGMTLQPSWAFKFWLDTDRFPETLIRDHSAADVISMCDAFQDSDNWAPRSAIGVRNNVVWLTPDCLEAGKAVAECLSFNPSDRERKFCGTRLRELLGLIRREPGDQAVVAYSRQSLDDMANDKNSKLSAPTILDARGYERYRHWPVPGEGDKGYGRTFELNERTRVLAGRKHGAREIVRRAMPFDIVDRFEYVGKIGITESVDDVDKIVPSAREFALEITGGKLIHDILNEIEVVLDV